MDVTAHVKNWLPWNGVSGYFKEKGSVREQVLKEKGKKRVWHLQLLLNNNNKGLVSFFSSFFKLYQLFN